MSSAAPPEFFLDRGLGRTTAANLRAAGLTVHLLAELYPADGDDIADEVWIADMSAALLAAVPSITRAVDRTPVGFWHVYRDGKIRRMWP